MPLKEMHLRPTSRISSAAWTLDPRVDATLWREASDSGELRVKVAADCDWLAHALSGLQLTYRDCDPWLQADFVLRGLVGDGLVDIRDARRRSSGISPRMSALRLGANLDIFLRRERRLEGREEMTDFGDADATPRDDAMEVLLSAFRSTSHSDARPDSKSRSRGPNLRIPDLDSVRAHEQGVGGPPRTTHFGCRF
jgi:hypothetical protein